MQPGISLDPGIQMSTLWWHAYLSRRPFRKDEMREALERLKDAVENTTCSQGFKGEERLSEEDLLNV